MLGKMSSTASVVSAVSAFVVPGPPLSDFVSCFWYVAGPPPATPKERVLPDGAVQLIFNLRDGGFRTYDKTGDTVDRRSSGAIVTGPTARSAIIDARDTSATVGVSFRPGGAAPFAGAAPSTFVDTDVEVDAVWGREACDRLHSRLADAASPRDAFVLLEEALIDRFSTRLLPHPGVRHALDVFTRTAHAASIGQVREAVGLSHRRFIDVFTRAVGLTPKTFCRVRRFQRALRLAHQGHRVRWSELALTCGYSDQAHMARDFRDFSGLTPSEWAGNRTTFHNHVRI